MENGIFTKEFLKNNPKLKWAFLGDSITHGLIHTHNKNSYSEYFDQFLVNNLKRLDDIVINYGVSGATSEWLNFFLDEVIDKADIFFIAFGMNDSSIVSGVPLDTFYKNIKRATRKLKEANKIVILQTTNDIKRDYGEDKSRLKVLEYYEMVAKVAHEETVPYFNLQEKITTQYLHAFALEDLFSDEIHPNEAMHELWFLDLVTFLFGEEYDNLFIREMRRPRCENELVTLKRNDRLLPIKDARTPFYFLVYNSHINREHGLHFDRDFLYHFKEGFHSRFSLDIYQMLKYFVPINVKNNPYQNEREENILHVYIFQKEEHVENFDFSICLRDENNIFIFSEEIFNSSKFHLEEKTFPSLLILKDPISIYNAISSSRHILKFFYKT